MGHSVECPILTAIYEAKLVEMVKSEKHSYDLVKRSVTTKEKTTR